jgi:hypothetical protein
LVATIRDNQFVHKGDLLMVIDPTNYNIAVSRDAAAVQQAQANMQNAAREAKRRQELSDLAVKRGSAAEMPPAHLTCVSHDAAGEGSSAKSIVAGAREDNRGLETRSCRVYRIKLRVTDDAHPMTFQVIGAPPIAHLIVIAAFRPILRRSRQLLERRRPKPTYYRRILSVMEQINRSALLFVRELITGSIACALET